jgi:hypothetical protein
MVSAVTIQQILTAYIDKGVSGNSGSVFVDPAVAAYEAGLVAPTEIVLTCVNPDALPEPINLTLNLRKPEFGDADIIDQFRVQRESIGGALEIYQDQCGREPRSWNSLSRISRRKPRPICWSSSRRRSDS